MRQMGIKNTYDAGVKLKSQGMNLTFKHIIPCLNGVLDIL